MKRFLFLTFAVSFLLAVIWSFFSIYMFPTLMTFELAVKVFPWHWGIFAVPCFYYAFFDRVSNGNKLKILQVQLLDLLMTGPDSASCLCKRHRERSMSMDKIWEKNVALNRVIKALKLAESSKYVKSQKYDGQAEEKYTISPEGNVVVQNARRERTSGLKPVL